MLHLSKVQAIDTRDSEETLGTTVVPYGAVAKFSPDIQRPGTPGLNSPTDPVFLNHLNSVCVCYPVLLHKIIYVLKTDVQCALWSSGQGDRL